MMEIGKGPILFILKEIGSFHAPGLHSVWGLGQAVTRGVCEKAIGRLSAGAISLGDWLRGAARAVSWE